MHRDFALGSLVASERASYEVIEFQTTADRPCAVLLDTKLTPNELDEGKTADSYVVFLCDLVFIAASNIAGEVNASCITVSEANLHPFRSRIASAA